MNDGSVNICVVDSFNQDILRQVIALGDANSNFLGHFPASCYQRESGNRRILAAIENGAAVCGYLLFRIARQRAVIQHLCVHENYRRHGVGRLLVDALKQRTQQLSGIELHCAREFEATKFWVANKFVPVGEKPGRGVDQRPLTRYIFDHRNFDLITSQLDALRCDVPLVVVDTNVAYDWQDPDRPNAKESCALRADWLTDEIDLRITDLAFLDADRANDATLRERRKRFISGIPKVNEDRAYAEEIVPQIAQVLPSRFRVSTEVDARHLAAAIAAGASTFITRDADILEAGSTIQRRFGINITHPAGFIASLDQIRNAHLYEPARLSGSRLCRRRLSFEELESVARMLLRHDIGESLQSLVMQLRSLIAYPRDCQVEIIESSYLGLLAIVGLDCRDQVLLRVPIFRLVRSSITSVLARHLAKFILRTAISRGSKEILIEDAAEFEVPTALEEIGFVRQAKRWRRIAPVGLHTLESLRGWLPTGFAESWLPERVKLIDESATAAERLEVLLWPVRIRGAELKSFVVPIQRRWAEHLFDVDLANETLLGGDPLLMLNTENVYYKSSATKVLSAPARILWYVSKEKGRPGTGAIRAVSSLMSVEIDSAKSLFRKFRRFGVYGWSDLMRQTGNDPHGQLMAARFGSTECFRMPVTRSDFGIILARYGKPEPPLTTAYELPAGMFEDLYERASGTVRVA